MPSKHDEKMAKFDEQWQINIDAVKEKIDVKAQENINKVDAWLDETYGSIVEMTEKSIDEGTQEDAVDEAVIALAQTNIAEHTTTENNNYGKYSYGFAAASIGIIAAATYIFKKQQKKVEIGRDTRGEDFEYV